MRSASNGTPVSIVDPFVMTHALDEAGFRQVVADARARRQASVHPASTNKGK